MEGDEVFSYISSTSMGGFKGICYLDDQTWYEADYFQNALTATGEERFNIKMVFENQAMDVHPPLYYLFMNVICSIFEGEFSRWFGIGLNIFFLLMTGIFLYFLLQYFCKNKYFSCIVSAIFCNSFLAVHMVLFIRMYVLLMALFVLQSWYHLCLYDKINREKPFQFKKNYAYYILLGILTITGALTHYYFLVYQCLISFFFVLVLLKQKRLTEVRDYIVTMIISGIFYICMYPAVLNHMFFKYRGRDAVYKFLHEETLLGSVISMWKTFDEQAFKGFLTPLLLLLLVGTVIMICKDKITKKGILNGLILVLPSLIYFFGISKASPFVTIRYVAPVAVILYALIAVLIKVIWDSFTSTHIIRYCGYGLVIVLLFSISFYFQQKPIKEKYFIERQQHIEVLSEDADYCIYVTGDEYNWKMWEDYVAYPQFDALYFIDGRTKAPISDETLTTQDELVIYIDKTLDLEEIYEYFTEYLPLQDYEIQYESPYTYIVLAQK